MTIHAHPDDESSKGAGSVALYSDAGVTATLVCCTGGEEGDILNAAMDRPEIKENLAMKIKDSVEQIGLNFAFPSQSVYIEKFEK